MTDLGVRREVLVWRDRWFLNTHREYARLREDLSLRLDLALSALDDNHITKKLDDLVRDLLFPMLDSFEGKKRRSILINSRAELHQIFESATSHGRERMSFPALIYVGATAPWEQHPEFRKLLSPTIWQKLSPHTHANACRQALKIIVDDFVFADRVSGSPSCKARMIGVIDLAAKEALRDA